MLTRAHRYIFWSFFCASIIAMMGVVFGGWPASLRDHVVSASAILFFPFLLNRLSGGKTAFWFSRLRHQRLWTAIYCVAALALVTPSLGWPMMAALLIGCAAAACAVWVLLGLRPVVLPNEGHEA